MPLLAREGIVHRAKLKGNEMDWDLSSERVRSRTSYGLGIAAFVALGFPDMTLGPSPWLSPPFVLAMAAVVIGAQRVLRLLELERMIQFPMIPLLCCVVVGAIVSQVKGAAGLRVAEISAELLAGLLAFLVLLAHADSTSRVLGLARALASMTAIASTMVLISQSLVWLEALQHHESRYWRFQLADLVWVSSVGVCLSAFCYQNLRPIERPLWLWALCMNSLGLAWTASPWAALAFLGAVVVLVGSGVVQMRVSIMTGVMAVVFAPLLMGTSGLPLPVETGEGVLQQIRAGFDRQNVSRMLVGGGRQFEAANTHETPSAYVNNYLQSGLMGGVAALGCLMLAGLQFVSWQHTPPRHAPPQLERLRHYLAAATLASAIAWIGAPHGQLPLLFGLMALLGAATQTYSHSAILDRPPIPLDEDFVAKLLVSNGALIAAMMTAAKAAW